VNIRHLIHRPSQKKFVVVDAAPAIIVADWRKKGQDFHPSGYGSPAELLGGIRPLPFDGARVIPRLAISHELDAGNGNCAYQEDMHEAPLVQEKLQNEPNQKK